MSPAMARERTPVGSAAGPDPNTPERTSGRRCAGLLQSRRATADPEGMLLSRRLPALFSALILFALIVAASADARPLTGSPGADRLTVRTASGNTVRASGGNDRVIGGAGPDLIYGETG